LFRVEALDDFIQQLGDAGAVFSRNFRDRIETELKEFHRRSLRSLVVGLVDREHHGNSGLAQFARDALVSRNQAFASVHEEDQQIGADDGALSLLDDQLVQRILALTV
jgi:hypothetical protein